MPQDARRWPTKKGIGLLACVASLAGAGLVGGMAFAAMRPPVEAPGPAAGSVARPAVDVLHNPPLVYTRGEPVRLEFEVVCPQHECREVDGVVVVRPEGGEAIKVESARVGGALVFDVPAAITGAESFAYHADFVTGGSALAQYPAPSATLEAVSIGAARVIDLGRASWSADEAVRGTVVAEGGWGVGIGDFGRNEQGNGPSSFDIGPDGELVVVDRVNGRLVRIPEYGSRENVPIDLSQGEPDLAVSPDGSLLVLNASAGPGLASIDEYRAGAGKAMRLVRRQVRLPAAGNAIRRIGEQVFVEADDSWWTPIWRAGRFLSGDEQSAAGVPGVPSADGGTVVMRKHLRGAGNEVRVVVNGPDGIQAWRLVGDTDLGPVMEASMLEDGRILVVQSQFGNTHSQHTVLILDGDDVERFVIPAQNYAGGYSEFVVTGHHLYQQRSTKAGYGVYAYDLGEK